MNRLLLTLFIMICIPNYGYAQFPPMPTGEYQIIVSNGMTIVIDTVNGQTWSLHVDKNNNCFWAPLFLH